MSEQKTVRVRIAVAVDDCGCWYAIGSNDMPDDEALWNVCEDDLRGAKSAYFIEADLPIPSPVTIRASVVAEATQ